MLRRDVIVTFTGQTFRVILGILGSALLTRALGPDRRGLYALAMLLPITMERILDVGLIGVNSTFPGLYRDQRKALFAQTAFYTLLASALGLLGMMAYFFWLPLELGRFAQLPSSIVLIAMFLIPAGMVSTLLREFARGCEQIIATVAVSTAGFAVRAAAILVFVTLLDGGLPAAMWITLGVPALLALCHLWQVRRWATLDVRCLSWRVMKESFRFGGILTLSSGARFLTTQVAFYLLSYMAAPMAHIGFFAVAAMVSAQLQIIPTSVAQAFLPRASNDPQTRLKQTPFVFRCTAAGSFVTMIALALLGPPAIIVLYGWKFTGSILPLLIMLPGIMAAGATRVLGMYVWVRKKPQYMMVNNWIALILTTGLGVILVLALGFVGAAIAYSTGLVLRSLLNAMAYRKLSGVPLRELIPRRAEFKLVGSQALALLKTLRHRR